MKKKNCWEFKKCGREPGGNHEKELGCCPAALEQALDSLHGGKNAGRACWVIAGTLCEGKVQGSFAKKLAGCTACDFYKAVEKEEEGNYLLSTVLLKRLKFSKDAGSR
jgi:hypothetical protein